MEAMKGKKANKKNNSVSRSRTSRLLSNEINTTNNYSFDDDVQVWKGRIVFRGKVNFFR